VIKLNLIKPPSPSPCSWLAAHLQGMGAQSCNLVVHFLILSRSNSVPWWRYCLYFLCTYSSVSDFAGSWSLWFSRISSCGSIEHTFLKLFNLGGLFVFFVFWFFPSSLYCGEVVIWFFLTLRLNLRRKFSLVGRFEKLGFRV